MNTPTPLVCRRCACPHVRFEQRRDGSWYLAIAFDLERLDREQRAYHRGGVYKRPHQCGQCARCIAIAEAPRLAAENAERRTLVEAIRAASTGPDKLAAIEAVLAFDDRLDQERRARVQASLGEHR